MIVFSIFEDTMKRPKTSKIVVYTIAEDTRSMGYCGFTIVSCVLDRVLARTLYCM